MTRVSRTFSPRAFTALLAVSLFAVCTIATAALTSFEQWAATEEISANLIPGSISQSPDGDLNGDGISNLAAYCSARSPTAFSGAPLTEVTFSNDRLRLRYEFDHTRSDGLLLPEVSTDLLNWIPLGSNLAPASFIDGPGQGQALFAPVREASILREGTTRYFLRLRAKHLIFHAGQFPHLFAAIADNTKPIRIVGIGSSVGAAENLPFPETQAPVQVISSLLRARFDPHCLRAWSCINKSINGSTVSVYAGALLDNEVIALQPTVVFIHAGMNDGRTYQFNGAQPPPFLTQQLKQIIARLKSAGADVVIVTSPHPHTQRADWSLQTNAPMTYPHYQPAPVSDSQLVPSVANSITTYTHSSGAVIPVSARHLQINQTFRQVSSDEGIALLDAEARWFDLVVQYGENALFDSNEVYHPNLLGHTSYSRAADDFVFRLEVAYQQHRRLNP